MHGRRMDGWSMVSKMESEDPVEMPMELIRLGQLELVEGVVGAWCLFCLAQSLCRGDIRVCVSVCMHQRGGAHGQSLYLVMIRLFASTATHCENVCMNVKERRKELLE